MQAPLIKTSHSEIMSFDRCQFAHDLSYRQQWQKKEKKANLAIGTIYHECLAIHYSNPGQDTVALIKDYLKLCVQQWKEEVHGTDLNNLNIAGRLAIRFVEDFAAYADRDWDIVDVEKYVEVDIKTPKGRPYTLCGVIDRLAIHKENRKLWVVEGKTVGQGKFWSDIEILMDAQTPTYAAALREMGLDVFGIVYDMANTYQYAKPQEQPIEKFFQRKKTYRTPTELDNFLIETGRQVDIMIEAKENPDFIPRRSLKRDCAGCFFQEPCLLSMKGVDIAPILEVDYMRRERGSADKNYETASSPSFGGSSQPGI